MATSLDAESVFVRRARRVREALLDAFLPPQCLSCTAGVSRPGELCAACWADVRFIAPPQCARCGMPFELPTPAGALCGVCLRAPPAFGRARAVFGYEGVGRALVLGFKNADRTHGVPAFAAWLERAGAELLAEAELLVPVPLHSRRLFARRFNQSALLARALSGRTGLPWAPDALRRTRPTRPQTSLSAAERAANVRGAFAARVAARRLIEGRRLLLIDDVLTTGATAGACARALLEAGAAGVDVLTLARRARNSG
jgi:ComF family protein